MPDFADHHSSFGTNSSNLPQVRILLPIPLKDLPLQVSSRSLPPDVRTFIREAERRIEQFRWEHHVPGFVPSDFAAAFTALRALEESEFLSGGWFCEWGSGFGVAACLATMLGFEACGIEYESELVEAARCLAADFDLPAVFARGSFIPSEAAVFAEAAGRCAWLAGEVDDGYERLELAPDDFDVIYAYPWPDEEQLTASLFERYARDGAVLMTYHEVGGFRLRRKARKG